MAPVNYQPLFTISLLHDYYAEAAFDDVLIMPSAATQTLLQNQKIIFRATRNTFSTFIATVNDQAIIPAAGNTLFRFYLFIKNSAFFNFTALPAGIYYFSNKTTNIKNGRLYLSVPVPAYSSTETYIEGSLTTNGNRIFECIKPNTQTDKHDTSESDYWRDIIAHNLLTTKPYSDTTTYTPGNQIKADAKLFECTRPNSPANKHNPADIAYWREITDEAYITVADGWAAPDTGLPPGLFATIDIMYDGGEKPEYTFMNAEGHLFPKTYFLRFKNRSTFWKYISQKKAITSITDTSDIYSFSNAAQKDEFVSEVPVPLRLAPLQSLKMNATTSVRNVEISGLQNPDTTFVKSYPDADGTKTFSEIYLNY